MPYLRLPLWLVTERTHEIPPSYTPRDDSRSIHAFASTEKLTAYLEKQVAGTWKVSLVGCRDRLFLAIAEADRHGAKTVCFDPDADGSGGESIDLATMFAQCEPLENKHPA